MAEPPRDPLTPVPAGTRRGKLRIFFGYAAGVGLTPALIEAARRARSGGTRVVVGAIDPADLAAWGLSLADLEVLPPPAGPERERPSAAFDPDEAIRRKPEVLVLGDLSFRNSPGSRHRRRFQDVAELLSAGIHVWTSLEVQHIESLKDFVERITGSTVRDSVPDAVFDAAEEVELVDLPPEEILARIRAGRAPRPAWRTLGSDEEAQGKLLALRELALRRAADRLSVREEERRADPASPPVSPTSERLLVCVGSSPTSARVVRTACRMATSMHTPWVAVHVGLEGRRRETDERRLAQHLKLAESLGAETALLPGGDAAREILDYARNRGVTKIVIGKTGRPGWRSRLRPSLVDRVIAASGDIDVYVIRGRDEPPHRGESPSGPRRIPVASYAATAGALAAATGLAFGFHLLGLSDANLVLAFLLAVAAVAAWFGRGPAVAASIAAVLLFNFFFAEPRYTFVVHDSQYLFTFAVMLTIGILVSTLTARVRAQSVAARHRERRTELLYNLSRELSAATGPIQIVSLAEDRIRDILQMDVSVLLPDETGRLRPVAVGSSPLARDASLPMVAAWVHERGQIAGIGTETHADARILCFPLATPQGTAGVLATRPPGPDGLLLPDQRRLLETFAAQVALALQRDRLSEQVHRTLAEAETERLRNVLLSSVSHEFRTPLAVIAGASSSLLEAGDRFDPVEQRDLLKTISEESDRLSRLVDNLLTMTRLESGRIEPVKEWNVVEDLIGSALTSVSRQLEGRAIEARVPADFPLLYVDGRLVELVLINLLDNATRYSPAGCAIEVRARTAGNEVLLQVADAGPGLSADEKTRAFEKFFRGARARGDHSRGAGLGLAICAAVAELHRGSIRVEDREGGGARFVLSLPLPDQPPAIDEGATPPSEEGPIR